MAIKKSFKVIYFGIVDNKCGLRYEGSEDIASERS